MPLEELVRLAVSGDEDAMFGLEVHLAKGESISDEDAKKLEAVAKNNNANAQSALADYLSGSEQFGCFTMAVKYN